MDKLTQDLAEALSRFIWVCDSAPPVDFIKHLGDARTMANPAMEAYRAQIEREEQDKHIHY